MYKYCTKLQDMKEVIKIITVARQKKNGGVSYEFQFSNLVKMLQARYEWEEKFKIEGIEHYSFRVIDDTRLEVKYTLQP